MLNLAEEKKKSPTMVTTHAGALQRWKDLTHTHCLCHSRVKGLHDAAVNELGIYVW